MKDDDRILNQETNSLEQLLLSCARAEEPSPDIERRMLAPLLVMTSLPPPPPPQGVATTASQTMGLKWVTLAVGGLSLVGAATWFSLQGVTAEAPESSPSADPPPLSLPPPEEGPPAVAPRSPGATPREAPPPSETAAHPVSAASPELQPAREAKATEATKQSKEPSRPQEYSTLNEEMRILDQARAALAEGQQERALAILSRYEQKYPQGVLKPEATVLRVSALSAAGQTDQADDLKKDFLDQHPTSPHRRRLENDVPESRHSGN